MPNHFTDETIYLICGTDVVLELVTGDKGLADALREHGPEALTVYVQLWDGSLDELTNTGHQMVSADDQFKYYRTGYRSARTGLVADIGWDV